MTYGAFLLIFLVPPITVLTLWMRSRSLPGVTSGRMRISLPLTALIAFVYTTPWDNYLVYRGVWGYGTDRVIGVIGYVPVEEYLFFLLQPFMTGLWLYFLLSRAPDPEPTPWRSTWGWIPFALLTILGVGLLASDWERGLYAGLILAWASPVLAGMWWYGGAHFQRHGRTMLLAIAVPTLYLWVADALAIHLGIWDISNRYSLNVDPLGLPVEEALFFLITNVLCVSGVLLFAHGAFIRPPGSVVRLLRFP